MRSTSYRRVLVLLDGSPAGERALRWVRELARGTDCVVHLLMVTNPARSVRDGGRVVAFVDQLEDAARHAALAYLDRAATGLREDGLVVETHALAGRPLEVAWATADALAADLAVLSVTDLPADVARSARLPILVTGPGCLRSA
ncbi:MAG TPA: universal stress protein [Candidatus Nitrosotalea sp.]|nr:universal stress protein [Candidatus Nitrosotalea sp.]